MDKPKFEIGDNVYALVRRRGSYEPSTCDVGSKVEIVGINKVNRNGTITFEYTCDYYSGYHFLESEISSSYPLYR